MLQPNFRHLEMFRILMNTRNLTETARLMSVSQPAVSQALRELESQLGLKLFLRGGGRIKPTDEAIALLPEVERLFAQIGSLSFKATELRDSRAGRINVAATPVLANSTLPQAIASFRKERLHARLAVLSLSTAAVVDMVKQGSADLGFAFSPIDETLVGTESLFVTTFCCLLPRDHPLTERPFIEASDLVDHTVIALTEQIPPGLLLRDELRKRKHDDLVRIETNSASVALALVRAGAGVAIVDPLPLLSARADDIAVRPFDPAVSITAMALFSPHRPIPRIAQQFIRCVREALHDCAVRLTSMGAPSTAV